MTSSPNTLTPMDKLVRKQGKWPIEGHFACNVALTFRPTKPPESVAEQFVINQFNTELAVLGCEFGDMLEKICKEKFT